MCVNWNEPNLAAYILQVAFEQGFSRSCWMQAEFDQGQTKTCYQEYSSHSYKWI